MLTWREAHILHLRALVDHQVARAWGTTDSVRSDLKKAASESQRVYKAKFANCADVYRDDRVKQFVKNILNPAMSEYRVYLEKHDGSVNYRATGYGLF